MEYFIKKSRYAVRPREVTFMLEKLETGPYWERLLATRVKQPWLRIDFKNWVDEEDEPEEDKVSPEV